jgi:hypothetical protein
MVSIENSNLSRLSSSYFFVFFLSLLFFVIITKFFWNIRPESDMATTSEFSIIWITVPNEEVAKSHINLLC